MTVKLNCTIAKGLIPAEKTVFIQRADGAIEEVIVSNKNLSGGKLEASEIGRNKNRILIELPRESASGRWRIWVAKSSIGA
jgi:dCTP deaminase